MNYSVNCLEKRKSKYISSISITTMHETPILALSEQANSAERVLALDCGADDVLNKPYDLEECLARAPVYKAEPYC